MFIGQKFANLEMKTILSEMVQNFEILPPSDELVSKNGYIPNYYGLCEKEKQKCILNSSKYTPILAQQVTLKALNGIHIRLRERT